MRFETEFKVVLEEDDIYDLDHCGKDQTLQDVVHRLIHNAFIMGRSSVLRYKGEDR
jgi:hypothetical protein